VPFNFLNLSESWRKKMESHPSLARRYDILAEEADETFFLRKRMGNVVKRLQAENLPVPSVHVLSTNGIILRTAFRFLLVEAEEKDRMCEDAAAPDNKREYAGVRCFVKDGIETWEQIEELLRQQEEEKARAQASADASEKGASSDIPETDADEPDMDDLIGRVGEELLRQLGSFLWLIEELRVVKKLLESELAHLRPRVAQLQTERDAAQEAAEQSSLQLQSLQAELQKTQHHRLHELALAVSGTTEGRQLYLLVQKMQRQHTAKRPDYDLPLDMQDGSQRKIAYEDRFFADMQKLSKADRRRVLDALIQFVKDAAYPSLKTKKRPGKPVSGAPADSFESRASDELRFIWKQDNENTITVYRAGRHSDFASSER